MTAIAQRVGPVRSEAGSESFEALYERVMPRVFGYVASLLGDRAAAEDVTAQAFERAYRKRRSYRARRGSPEQWLFGIARNAALDELRRRKRSAGLGDEPPDLAAPSPDDDVESILRRDVVREALTRLDGPERDLISLRFAGGLSHPEIAKVLGISESNAQTKLHRTIAKLREACREQA